MDIVLAGVTVSIANSGALSVLSGLIALTGGWPSVNNRVFHDVPAVVSVEASGSILATYNLGPQNGTFVLRAANGAPDGLTLQYTLRDVPAGATIDSFGLKFDAVGGMKRYYQSGYHSWDGSSYVQPAGLETFTAPQLSLERSYAVTQFIPNDGQAALVAGFDRHDRFQQTFSFGTRRSPPDLSIATWWDRKPVDPVTGAVSEKLWLLQDPSNEEGLRHWARIVSAASPIAPRVNNPPLIGWDSWYNLYDFINEGLIRDSLASVSAGATQQNLPMRTFLIDAGFTPELGDWLNTNYAFPNGMPPLMSAIQQAGFTPGLWIAPLLVGNRSQLYSAHPDWILQDAVSGGPKIWAAFYGEQRFLNMRSEEYYVLDTTVPAALDYLRTVFRTWRKDWGAQVFKVDFSYLGTDWGPDVVQRHNPGLTRIETWRQFAELVRQEIGDDAIWVASGQPLWASVGLADTIRISGDVGVVWSGAAASALPLLHDLPVRNFANHILWQIDPDAVLLRQQFEFLSDGEVRSLALLAGMSGGAMVTSDNLGELSGDRLALWKMLLSQNWQTCSYPRLGQDDIVYAPFQAADGTTVPVAFSDPMIVQVRALAAGGWMAHILNTGSDPVTRTYALGDLGIAGSQYVWDYAQAAASNSPLSQVTVSIASHGDALLYLSGQPIANAPINLGGDF